MTTFLILWLTALAGGVALVWLYTVGMRRRVTLDIEPPVAVIVAVKGHDREFDEFLVRLFEQEYSNFRVIFAVESEDDDAVPVIRKCCELAPHRVELVVAGRATDEGQKTANLRAAVSRLRYDDEILVFADADIWPEKDWLMRLVNPLLWRRADIVTGFRWVVAKDSSIASLISASIAAMVATIPRLPYLNGAWGGSTAIRQDQFRALDVSAKWRGVLSDDLQLTNIAVRAGLKIEAPRELLLRTFTNASGYAGVVAEMRRWYMMMRVHMPVAYAVTLLIATLGALGWVLAIGGALLGRADAIVVLTFALLFAVARLFARRRLVRTLWGKCGLAENRLFLFTDWAVAPFAMLTSAACGWSALLMHRTTWAGITYEVRGPRAIDVLSRGMVNKL